mgnify:FL=1
MIQIDKRTSFHNYGQSSKRLEIIYLRENFPELTLREIGEKVELTRERVRQILTTANLATKSLARISTPLPLCATCNKTLAHKRLKFCNQKCQFPNGKTTFQCSTCGMFKTVMTSAYRRISQKNSKIYCSRICRGRSRRKI